MRNEPGGQENGIQLELSWIYRNVPYMLHAAKEKKIGGGEEIRIHYLVYKISGFFNLKKKIIMEIVILF